MIAIAYALAIFLRERVSLAKTKFLFDEQHDLRIDVGDSKVRVHVAD